MEKYFIVKHTRRDEGAYAREAIQVPRIEPVASVLSQILRRLQAFILLHDHTSLATVPNISTDEAALLALKSHISSSDPNNIGLLPAQCAAGLESVAALATERYQALSLYNNVFTGPVPASIFNMLELQIIGLAGNRFSVTLPSDFDRQLPNLENFSCSSNLLSDFISSSISNSSRLTGLDISWNSFTDPIPESLGNLEYLEILHLGSNKFFSDSALSFLTSLTNCRELRVFKFDRNPLDGVFPASVGNFSAMQNFEGQGCKLKGVVPEEIGNLTGMKMMSLQNNELAGHIPKNVEPSRTLPAKQQDRRTHTRYYLQFKESWCIRLIRKPFFWFSATMLRKCYQFEETLSS
nr:LRR receptor-like serine/threonine-protein kinase FLS2 [Nicotiana tomentosiformis]